MQLILPSQLTEWFLCYIYLDKEIRMLASKRSIN